MTESAPSAGSSRQTLCEQHTEIRNFALAIRAMTEHKEPPDIEKFGRIRVAISRALRDHFAAEDRALGKLLWSQTGTQPQLLADWEAKRQEFRLRYSQHVRDWSLADTLRDWPGYIKALNECISAGDALARFEETKIYPLI